MLSRRQVILTGVLIVNFLTILIYQRRTGISIKWPIKQSTNKSPIIMEMKNMLQNTMQLKNNSVNIIQSKIESPNIRQSKNNSPNIMQLKRKAQNIMQSKNKSPNIMQSKKKSQNIVFLLADERGETAKNLIYDIKRQSVRMWPDDKDNCSRIVTHFGINTDWSWLISYPRSGNTWTRYLLEASTGVFTGNVHSSKLLKGMQYLGEKDNPFHNTTVVVKTHHLPREFILRQKKTIMLIRNPERSIVSYWNWKMVADRSHRHTGNVSNDTLFSPEFFKFASQQIINWEKNYSSWITNLPHLLPVYYELLRDDPIRHVQKMLSFMNIKAIEERLDCVSNHLDGRMKGAQRTISPYTSEQKTQLMKAVENISNQLQARGFPPLPRYENYES